jgi:transcriptional regulator, LysR family
MTVTFSERLIDPIDEGIDLLVRIGELADSSGLVYRKLTTQKLVICAAPEYLHANGYPKEITDIAKHQCIVGLRKNKPKTWIFKENDNELIRYAPSSIQVFADGDAMLAAVLAGCGISQLPLWLVEEYIATGELVVVLDNYSGAEVPINLLWPKERNYRQKFGI